MPRVDVTFPGKVPIALYVPERWSAADLVRGLRARGIEREGMLFEFESDMRTGSVLERGVRIASIEVR